ncbi:endolytic transglycosylase MltG [Nocardiopsis quinghaiensis]|uniref:endolytic transglycosylase MltG n=1 Tax=Nocardiopsis quinghaiensis TaxID=464995 RepID=UPI00123AB52E|nr:endolytic transglycosylase MltG [Nocardiopsis quinghaiensis]
MNDRDDYPGNPYRGRSGRERGYDYDPLSDPSPPQPPPRGRRARPEPADWSDAPGTGGFRNDAPDAGEFRSSRYAPGGGEGHDPLGSGPPPSGRRRRAEPPIEGPGAPPRRVGAADALRGSRAARSGTSRSGRPQPQGPEEPRPHEPTPPRRAAGDPTQEALAALANLGENAAPSRPAESAPRPPSGTEEPPRRGRRKRSEPEPGPEPEPRRRSRGNEDAPAGRRGGSRRRRGAPVEDVPAEPAAPPADERPQDRRGRRKRSRREEETTGGFLDDAPEDSGFFDSGSFPGLNSSADTGAFAAVSEPPGRRARRARADSAEDVPADTSAFSDAGAFRDAGASSPDQDPDAGAFAAEVPEEEPGPRSRRARRGRGAEDGARSRRGGGRRRRGAPAEEAPQESEAPYEEDPDAGAFAAEVPEEEPGPRSRRARRGRGAEDGARSRRSSRRRRGRREEPEVPEEAPEEDEYDYEEPALADIAAAYGGGRSSRRKAKELKRARAQADRGGRKRRRGGGKGMMILLALVLVLVIAGGGYGIMRVYLFPDDYEGRGSGEVVFVIEEGQAGATIASNLVGKGVVASEGAFLNALKAVPEEERGDGLVPGTYSLAQSMSGEAAVSALLDPASRVGGRVTIREGLRSEEIIGELAENTGLTEEEFNEAYARTDELGLPDYAAEGPAGYLFPDTYQFDSNMDALSVLKTMVTRHRQVAEEIDLEGRAEALGYDANEIMAIASIIQAESGNTEDMPKISRVVHNRLDIDMALQMDSTCFYAIGEHGIALNNEQLRQCELDTSGFDTYYSKGLIPGPYVVPGQDAMEAALTPAEGDWLYFVATDPENGVTEFTGSHDEFLKLKEEFQENWVGD